MEPRDYSTQRMIVRILQSAVCVIGLLATAGLGYLILLAAIDHAGGSGAGNGQIMMRVIMGWVGVVLLCGLAWALLAGLLAVFDIASEAADTNEQIKRLARNSRKEPAEPVRWQA